MGPNLDSGTDTSRMVFLLVGKGKPRSGVDRMWPPGHSPRGGLDGLAPPGLPVVSTSSTTRPLRWSRQARPPEDGSITRLRLDGLDHPARLDGLDHPARSRPARPPAGSL